MIPDYFALLGIEPAFDIDLAALEAAYFKAQRQYHPDRFIGKPPAERQQALQLSVDCNNGYQTLKDPHSRAVYLLKQRNIHVADSKEAEKPSQALLMEIMQWREDIDEAESPTALKAQEEALLGLKSEAVRNISQAFDTQDWQAMAQATMRLGYLNKTMGDIAIKAKRLALQA